MKSLLPQILRRDRLAPAASVEVGAMVATPLTRFALPIVVEPLKNSTVPVGVPDPGLAALTVAVKVTFCPITGAKGEYVTTVDEFASATFTVQELRCSK